MKINYEVVIAAVIILGSMATTLFSTKIEPTTVYAETTKEVPVLVTQGLPPILQRIADCESGGGVTGAGHQFNKDGSVVKNVNKDGSIDIGKWQVNISYHVDEISRMHLDVLTEEGNRAYAEYLYANRGTGDWASSQGCWKK